MILSQAYFWGIELSILVLRKDSLLSNKIARGYLWLTFLRITPQAFGIKIFGFPFHNAIYLLQQTFKHYKHLIFPIVYLQGEFHKYWVYSISSKRLLFLNVINDINLAVLSTTRILTVVLNYTTAFYFLVLCEIIKMIASVL